VPGIPIAGVRIACRPPVPADQLERAVAAARAADVAIVVVGTTPEYESEGFDRDSLSLPGDQDPLVWAVAAANPRTIVVLNTGAPVDAQWAGLVAGVAQGWFGGQEVGHGVADVLFGDVDPGGRLPTTYPVRLEDTPAFLDIPGSAGRVRYSEGVFMGYRWYDRRAIEPRWCFGHGLSYTTFVFSSLDATLERASLSVSNVGPVAGVCVVQVYVGAVGGPAASVPRPARELRGFAKVTVGAGETVDVTIDLDPPRRWEGGWVTDAGEYEVSAGVSSRDLRARAVVSVPPT
jgi:beta-glucosidase